MAAAQMPRPPYPPMSYHTPQSNSPASVASPSQHDQHRSLYGQAPSQHMPQSMYYQPQPPYQPMPPQAAHSPYGHHTHHPQQPMASQANLMMSHTAAPNQMPQHPPPHTQAGMTSSPRPKIEPQVPLQMQKQPQGSPMPQANHQQQPPQMQSPGGHNAAVNPNAAPGPIPATTPLVVRQDGNGVQWIAFEYSRDRVKMEYTIRCDVESVNTDELSADFKQENCVYPRACCPKDQYRGNRLMYETDCNRVGWALAQLNAPLRGKRGLIQRAVDSWRNSNQDPRLRSRRVRRMAKMNNRKQSQGPTHPPAAAHMPSHGPPPGLTNGPGSMGPSPTPTMESKPSLASMGQPMHHHHAGGHPGAVTGGGDEVADGNSHESDQTYRNAGENTTNPQDVRTAHVFTGYTGHGYPSAASGGAVSSHTPRTGSAVAAKQRSHGPGDDQDGLFPDLPEARKRKFVLVEDSRRGSRLRVRVTLDGVDTNEIPDSFRTRASVYPRSFFPREMQNPPPNALGAHFFSDDVSDDGIQDTDGRDISRRGLKSTPSTPVKVPLPDSQDGEIMVPRMKRSRRVKELKLNDMGHPGL
ncbi:ribosomal protein l24e [Cordyceps javanica]|nr:ribosomal protein l24e [Cordyceps javanica]